MQCFDHLTEPLPLGGEASRSIGGVGRNNEQRQAVVLIEAERGAVSTEGTLERCGENSREKLFAALRCAADAQHEGAPPTLNTHVTESNESQLASQVLSPGFYAGSMGGLSHSIGNAASDFTAQALGEILGCLFPRLFAESENQRDGEVDARRAFLILELTASEIVDDGSGGIETWRHELRGRKAILLMAV